MPETTFFSLSEISLTISRQMAQSWLPDQALKTGFCHFRWTGPSSSRRFHNGNSTTDHESYHFYNWYDNGAFGGLKIPSRKIHPAVKEDNQPFASVAELYYLKRILRQFIDEGQCAKQKYIYLFY
jgi:hypothetical protein